MEIILFFVILMISFITYGIIKYSLDNKGGVVNSTVVLALPVEPFWMMLGNKPGKNTDFTVLVISLLLHLLLRFLFLPLFILLPSLPYTSLFLFVPHTKSNYRRNVSGVANDLASLHLRFSSFLCR